MFDEPEMWRPVRNFPGFQISSEGRVSDPFGDILATPKKHGELYVNFSYFNYSYQGPVWRLILYNFYEFSMTEWKDVECRYRDDDPTNLDVFNLSFWRTDGTPIMFIRNEDGNWKRVRRNARKVQVIETGDIYDSAKDAAEGLGGALNTLYLHLRGNTKTFRGLHLEYLD